MDHSPPNTFEQYQIYQQWLSTQQSQHTPSLTQPQSSQSQQQSPSFLSPTNSEIPIEEITYNPRDEDKFVGRTNNYDLTEDLVLFKSWLAVSEDPITGNEQRGATFWGRIAALFNSEVKHLPGIRKLHSLENRYCTVNKCVVKYIGLLGQATARRGSGCSDMDVISKARTDYKNFVHKKGFTHEEVYELVKDHPKWLMIPTEPNVFTMSNDSEGGSSNPACSLSRPPGKKQSKKRVAERSSTYEADNRAFFETVTVDINEKKERCASIVSRMDHLIDIQERQLSLQQPAM